jgi:hypothetical protein
MKNWLNSQFCFELYDTPIVIEPGVGALEINVFLCDPARPSSDPKARCKLWWRFERLELDGNVAEDLPFIPTTKYPHIFTMSKDLQTSPFLLVYDLSGRLAFIYKKEGPSNTWVCHNVIDEVRGKTISQFSVRFSFSSSADRNEFMTVMDKLSESTKTVRDFDHRSLRTVMRLLGKSRISPVAATVAIEKKTAKVK